MNTIQTRQITVPLGIEAHRKAQQFAAEQATPQKRKRVYLNTLAVYAVHNFLNWLKIETDLEKGDSWHSGLRALLDVADLVLPNLGKLECRPIPPEEIAFTLPSEVTFDRIGYIGVQFEESLTQVHLLGFVGALDTLNPPTELQITDLQPLDDFIDHIYLLLSSIPSVQPALPQKPMLINLRQWFENIFETGWQTVEALLETQPVNLALNLRSNPNHNVERAKQIDLGSQIMAQSVVLVVVLTKQTSPEIKIVVEVHPANGQTYLPPHLLLTVLDSEGASVMEARASCANKNIQLRFSGIPEETFSVKVALGDVSITENFVL